MFDAVRFIEEKRDGRAHEPEELQVFVESFHKGDIPDYQASSWLMAAFLRGLDKAELVAFTLALAKSGKVVEFPDGLDCVDKHSTGGVGDKTSLVLVPLVAACGVPVAKLSGRGLGFTGGTVDKLESIPGFNAHLSMEGFVDQVRRIGCAISGHSGDLAPAEKRFYELRDVTGTIPSIPLIASSILSKKLAGGSRSFVFDVKAGSGAFMKDLDGARALARQLVDLSKALGRKSLAVISGMEQPLGRWVGNAAEVREAIEVLRGSGPTDTTSLCVSLGGAMVFLAGRAACRGEGEKACREALVSGKALEHFRLLLEAQGGSTACLESPEKELPLSTETTLVRSGMKGRLASFGTDRIGTALRYVGGGRQRKEDAIDPGVAVEILAKIGDEVSPGSPVLALYHRGGEAGETAARILAESFTVAQEAAVPPLIHETVK